MTAAVLPGQDPGRPVAPVAELRPLPDEVPGHLVLDQVAEFVARFVAFPDAHCLPVVTLWAAHTWAADAFYTTPRLVLDSAEPGSGKTRVLELLNLFCRDPEMVLSPTTAALFRMLAERPYSLLFDEVDAIFNTKNAGNYEDLRAMLNAGYKRTATIPRCVGDAKAMKIQRFKVFAPVALAGIAGNLPATITTRAVTIHMRRRGPAETVEPFEEEDAEAESAPLRTALSAWAALPGTVDAVRVRPLLPAGVVDRAAEVWRPLVAVADAAGGHWPIAARDACRAFVLDRGPEAVSLGVRLLGDLRSIFTRRDADRLPSTELVRELTAIEDGPWADLYGKPLDARRLAKELSRYDIHPTTFRIPAVGAVKGYQVGGNSGLGDAWTRYVPAPSGNSRNGGNSAGQSLIAFDRVTATSVTPEPTQDHVTDVAVTADPAVPPLTSAVTAVTDVTDEARPRPTIVRRVDGPCHDCGQPTQRYGPGGNARCPTCLATGPQDTA